MTVVEVVQNCTEFAYQFTLVKHQVILRIGFFELRLSLNFLSNIHFDLLSGLWSRRFLLGLGRRTVVFMLDLVETIVSNHPDEGTSNGPVFLEPFQESRIVLVIFELLFFVLNLSLGHFRIIDQRWFTLDLNWILVLEEVLDYVVISYLNLVIRRIELLK